MNKNKVSNPEVSVPKGIELNDKDYINSLLTSLKEMEKNYALAMTEASNEFIYEKYKEIFLKISDLSRNVFELMFKNGWYALEKAEQKKITTKLDELKQEYKNLKS